MSGLAETSPIPFPFARRHEPRIVVLPVAEIFSVLNSERCGQETIATVIVGDDRHPPKRHGLRATRRRWVQLVAALADEDEDFRAEALAALGARAAAPNAAQAHEPILKPGGRIL